MNKMYWKYFFGKDKAQTARIYLKGQIIFKTAS